MAEIVNLRQARKRKRRTDAQAKAAENRALHGQGADEKRVVSLSRGLEKKRLEAHRREPAPHRGESSD